MRWESADNQQRQYGKETFGIYYLEYAANWNAMMTF
jgi:hypothetical protein